MGGGGALGPTGGGGEWDSEGEGQGSRHLLRPAQDFGIDSGPDAGKAVGLAVFPVARVPCPPQPSFSGLWNVTVWGPR